MRMAGIEPRRVTLCLIGTPDIAATWIRRQAAAGRSLAGLVPKTVEAYIRERGLYGAQRPRA
jgi:nicotinic acid mononucleotide adenylyltransferase